MQILKNSGYHSEEWEETDPEDEWLTIQPPVIQEPTDLNEEAEIVREAVKKKTMSIRVYQKWWRSNSVCVFIYL